MNQVAETIVQDAILQSLLQAGKLTNEVAQKSLVEARKQEEDITTYLVDHKLATEMDIVHSCSRNYGIPAFQIDDLDRQFLPEEKLSENFITSKMVAPLFNRGQTLYVGIRSPSQLQILKEAEFESQLTIEPVLVEASKLDKLIRTSFSSIDSARPSASNSTTP